MEFIETPLKGLYIIHHKILYDERGVFARTFCKEEFLSINFNKEFIQFNQSYNLKKGTFRGMHYQNPPFAETKLIRCVRGSVFDIAVDIRKGSETFMQYYSIELSDKNMCSILIPEGFAHGFQTLEDHTSLIYHHTEQYKTEADAGFSYVDLSIGIKLPLDISTISQKDKSYPLLNKDFKGI
jgi:dTDP-4-dehydrorhamnose 3,5-epimerase